jgi:hypothetical protein
MKKRFRLLLVVGAGLLGLAFAGPSFAAFTPDLTVQQSSYKVGAGTTAGFVVTSDPANDPMAKMTIFSPAGYGTTLGQAPGSVIGKALAYVNATKLGPGVVLPLAGNVVVGNPADPTIMASSQVCTGSPTNQAVWILDTTLQGQSIRIPAYVNVVGPYVIQQICLQSPADPANTTGAQLVVANYSVKGVFTNAPTKGSYQWAGDFTPYVPGTTTVNPAGTVEWRTYVGLPSSLTFKKAKSKKKSLFPFTGALSVAGLNPKGIRLHLYTSTKAQPAPNYTLATITGLFGSGKAVSTKGVKSNGKYSITRKKPKGKKRFYQMRFEDYLLVPSGGDKCEGPSPSGQPIPCNGTSLAPLTSATIRR